MSHVDQFTSYIGGPGLECAFAILENLFIVNFASISIFHSFLFLFFYSIVLCTALYLSQLFYCGVLWVHRAGMRQESLDQGNFTQFEIFPGC